MTHDRNGVSCSHFGSESTMKVQSGLSVFEQLEGQLSRNLSASRAKPFPGQRGRNKQT